MVKNTYGVSVEFNTKRFGIVPSSEFTGSALQRKKQVKKKDNNTKKEEKKERKLRSLSPRSKQKIKKKITAFSRLYKRLSFVTLTFLNKVTDKQAVNLLGKFIDNIQKRSDDFQYVWVVERQTKNDEFKGNPHFHMITNKYWNIEKYWNYWLDLQKKNGILPREEGFKPSSAFDVKQLNSNNIRAIGSYVTKYVTKNKDSFDCQVWNCSKKVSQLYTDFYTSDHFLEEFDRLNAVKQVHRVEDEKGNSFMNVNVIDLNKQTLRLYRRLDEKNQLILKSS